MPILTLLVLLFRPLLLQEDQGTIVGLIETLRSEKVSEREDAVRKLKSLGQAAVPALQKAASDADPEVAQRAGSILRYLSVRDALSVNLRNTFPGIEERLSGNDPHEWTLQFLEGAGTTEGRRRYPGLSALDLEPLAAGSVRGAASLQEKAQICDLITEYKLASVAPEVAVLLKDGDLDVREWAVSTLGRLRNPSVLPQVLTVLQAKRPTLRRKAVKAIGELQDPSASERLMEGLEDDDEEVREITIRVLGEFGCRKAVPAIAKALEKDVYFVRKTAATALAELGSTESVGGIALLLKDPREDVRLTAITALCRLGSFQGVSLLLEAATKNPNISLTPLNWLRSPELMKRLKKGAYRLESLPKEMRFDVFAEKLSGLKVDDSKVPPGSVVTAVLPTETFSRWTNLLDAVDEAASDSQCGFILDPERLIFLPRAELATFWSGWTEAASKPKK